MQIARWMHRYTSIPLQIMMAIIEGLKARAIMMQPFLTADLILQCKCSPADLRYLPNIFSWSALAIGVILGSVTQSWTNGRQQMEKVQRTIWKNIEAEHIEQQCWVLLYFFLVFNLEFSPPDMKESVCSPLMLHVCVLSLRTSVGSPSPAQACVLCLLPSLRFCSFHAKLASVSLF